MESKEIGNGITGVIVPPPEIRAIVDKTAEFVARHGRAFEERILGSAEGQGAKFEFMRSDSPYHAYYEQKIVEYEAPQPEVVDTHTDDAEGHDAPMAVDGSDKDADGPDDDDANTPAEAETVTRRSKVTPIERFAMNRSEERPEELDFITYMPSDATAADVDIMRLTARYAAVRGQEFLMGLVDREADNERFGFLQPTHRHFQYFTHVVDCYARALSGLEDEDTGSMLEHRSTRMGALEAAVNRWVWHISDGEEKRLRQLKDDDRSAELAVDWNDFSVVETIDFEEEDKQLSKKLDEQQQQQQQQGEQQSGAQVQQPDALERKTILAADDETGENIVIVGDDEYDAAAVVGGEDKSKYTMRDPVSGAVVPVNDMSEHMRIQLMDPKWNAQNKRFQQKQSETGFAGGASIAASLKAFALRRGEMGSTVVSQVTSAPRMASDEGGPNAKRAK